MCAWNAVLTNISTKRVRTDLFMNQETFDQVPIARDLITGVEYMKEGDVVTVVSDASTETILYAEMPIKVVLKIDYTEPGLRGDTATNTLKDATLETGAKIRVPLFIELVNSWKWTLAMALTKTA